ncbi:uncharacterized protein DS421_11g348910 [Arachis hypogaea]|nr:uncharacterized protein DS421_11g348910 [Arachis hypogaea]
MAAAAVLQRRRPLLVALVALVASSSPPRVARFLSPSAVVFTEKPNIVDENMKG